jgi:hypothetical protein
MIPEQPVEEFVHQKLHGLDCHQRQNQNQKDPQPAGD